jgi:hypothetical protein
MAEGLDREAQKWARMVEALFDDVRRSSPGPKSLGSEGARGLSEDAIGA